MKIKHRLAIVALATGIAGGVMTAPASGAALNHNGANCNGAFISNDATNTEKPGQAAADTFGSVQAAHQFLKRICSL